MKESAVIPWKKIVFSSIISILLIFLLCLAVAMLCSNFIISFETGKLLMFPVVFISSFTGGMFIKSKDKNILYTGLSSLLTFLMMNVLGMFTANKVNMEYTLWVLAVFLFSTVISCIIKALFK